MVDLISSYIGGINPSLCANYQTKDNKLFTYNDGEDTHWPSVYIIEGLGQSCNLLIIISALEKQLKKLHMEVGSIDEVLRRLSDNASDEATGMLASALNQRLTGIYSNVGFLGSADIEITGHARTGQVISYEVQQNQAFGSLYHSTVRAYTDNNLIARGTLVSAERRN